MMMMGVGGGWKITYSIACSNIFQYNNIKCIGAWSIEGSVISILYAQFRIEHLLNNAKKKKLLIVRLNAVVTLNNSWNISKLKNLIKSIITF